ncbi:MAG: hypothetical protein IJ722_06955 [Alloprevotella sp.]|nr:hypothetical protein [Alloprevotella sp.]MBR1732808.1 hypothetical protein [Alloprevotella sp.]
MAVLFKKMARKHPRTKLVSYHPVVKSVKRVDRHDVAKLVADETTLNPMEAEMALAQLEKVLVRLLLQGYTVQMGEWASFNLTVTSDGAASEAECTAALIKQVRAHCRFTAKFRAQLQDADFVLATSLTETRKKKEQEEGE